MYSMNYHKMRQERSTAKLSTPHEKNIEKTSKKNIERTTPNQALTSNRASTPKINTEQKQLSTPNWAFTTYLQPRQKEKVCIKSIFYVVDTKQHILGIYSIKRTRKEQMCYKAHSNLQLFVYLTCTFYIAHMEQKSAGNAHTNLQI